MRETRETRVQGVKKMEIFNKSSFTDQKRKASSHQVTKGTDLRGSTRGFTKKKSLLPKKMNNL